MVSTSDVAVEQPVATTEKMETAIRYVCARLLPNFNKN